MDYILVLKVKIFDIWYVIDGNLDTADVTKCDLSLAIRKLWEIWVCQTLSLVMISSNCLVISLRNVQLLSFYLI